MVLFFPIFKLPDRRVSWFSSTVVFISIAAGSVVCNMFLLMEFNDVFFVTGIDDQIFCECPCVCLKRRYIYSINKVAKFFMYIHKILPYCYIVYVFYILIYFAISLYWEWCFKVSHYYCLFLCILMFKYM